MPPINVCIDFGSKKGHVAAGEPEEGKTQGRDCWSCRTCGNTKPVSMDVEKCRECEDGEPIHGSGHAGREKPRNGERRGKRGTGQWQ